MPVEPIKIRPIYAQILIEHLLTALEQKQHEIDVVTQELIETQNKLSPSQTQDLLERLVPVPKMQLEKFSKNTGFGIDMRRFTNGLQTLFRQNPKPTIETFDEYYGTKYGWDDELILKLIERSIEVGSISVPKNGVYSWRRGDYANAKKSENT